MKITIDLTPLYGRKKTGVEMYAIDLYKALLSTTHKIIPIFHQENEIDNNENAVIIPYTQRLLLENWKLSCIIRKIKPDIALFPIFPPPLDIYFFCKSKIVPTIHDVAFLKYRNTINRAAKYYLAPKALLTFKKANAIITISETVKKELQTYTDKPICNCGENISAEYKDCTSKSSTKYLKRWNLVPYNYFISVSTIEPRKNFKYLLKVIKPLLEKKNMKLVLVGRKGWGKDEELRQLIKDSENHIIFTEYVSLDCLISLYHFAFSFALLSLDEGFGRTPFEAAACGCKKIILSDIAIFHETFEKNALFLPLDNVEICRNILQSNFDKMPSIKNDFDIPFSAIEKKIHSLFSIC